MLHVMRTWWHCVVSEPWLLCSQAFNITDGKLLTTDKDNALYALDFRMELLYVVRAFRTCIKSLEQAIVLLPLCTRVKLKRMAH